MTTRASIAMSTLDKSLLVVDDDGEILELLDTYPTPVGDQLLWPIDPRRMVLFDPASGRRLS